MIQKTNMPIYEKLRIVQLFEGDFNGALKYFIGKLLMQHTTTEGLHDLETYGSRKGKTAAEALIALQLLYDNARIWKHIVGIIFNDAAGCYDRIPPQLGDIALRRLGRPRSVAHAHTQAQRNMAHYIRIAAGVSKASIIFADKQGKFL